MTHKIYSDLWRAPEGAKLALEARTQAPQTLVVGLDSKNAEVELTGDGQWQSVVLSPADFANGSGRGRGQADWRNLKTLKLSPKHKGDPRPEFRDLRWTRNGRQGNVGSEPK